MKAIHLLIISMAMALPVTGEAQETPQASADSAESVSAQSENAGLREIQALAQLAVLQIDSQVFADAWSGYLERTYKPGMDVDATIDLVIKEGNAFRSSIRVPGASGSRPRNWPSTVRENMRAIARPVIEEDTEQAN